jgi:hypothetical protein
MAIYRRKRIPAQTKTLLLLAAVSCVPVTGAQPEMKWWYREPAARYWEGLPLSNGRVAAIAPLGHSRHAPPNTGFFSLVSVCPP